MVEHHLLIHQGPVRWMEGGGGETGRFGRFEIDVFFSLVFSKLCHFGVPCSIRGACRMTHNLVPDFPASSTPEPWLCSLNRPPPDYGYSSYSYGSYPPPPALGSLVCV